MKLMKKMSRANENENTRSCADSESLKGAGLRDVRVFSDFTIYESSDVWHFQYQRIQIYFVYKVSSLKI